LGRRAFVVDRERAAPPGKRAVVDHRYAGRRDALAQASRERRAAFAVEVALEAVADGLVQQHARPARTEHHGHGAGGCGTRREINQCLRYGLLTALIQPFIGEVRVIRAPAAARTSAFAPAVP